MSSLDLRHLRIFLALYAAGNVSRAAENVGLSQSSVSVALAQLREHYGDPLFVRTAGGMRATPRAEQLLPLVRQALQLLDRSLEQAAEFQPADIVREFRVGMTDVGHVTILPRLLARLQRMAPGVSLSLRHLSHETARQLETGELDLAMGFTEDIRAGFYRQKLFDEGFACIASRQHPRIGTRMTLEQLSREQHVRVTLSATAHSVIDRILKREGVQRTIAANVPSFLGLAQVVANSELVAIVPMRLAAVFAAESGVKVVTPPVHFPPYAVIQYWHERYHRDPANAWLRSMVFETTNALPLPLPADDSPNLETS